MSLELEVAQDSISLLLGRHFSGKFPQTVAGGDGLIQAGFVVALTTGEPSAQATIGFGKKSLLAHRDSPIEWPAQSSVGHASRLACLLLLGCLLRRRVAVSHCRNELAGCIIGILVQVVNLGSELRVLGGLKII